MFDEMITEYRTCLIENAALRSLVTELSWDTAFGMLTRAAFLRQCAKLSSGARSVIFLDLNNIGALNLILGYTEVDRRIRETFATMQNPAVVQGRWYSGDEIALLLEPNLDPQQYLADLTREAAKEDLTFIAAIGRWDGMQGPVKAVIDGLTDEVCRLKRI